MIFTNLIQIGGAPDVAGLGSLAIWFSLVILGIILGVLGSIDGSFGGDRRGEALLFGVISVVLGFLTLLAPVVLILMSGGFSSLTLRPLLFIIL